MASTSLLQHYTDYLRSPSVLLAILIIVGPILWQVYKAQTLSTRALSRSKIEGCFRLGLTKGSNLVTQFRRQTSRVTSIGPNNLTGTAHIKALFTYPVKSCRGIELAASEVGTTGLKYDRLFTFAQLVSKEDKSKAPSTLASANDESSTWKHEWRFMTMRDFPRLALLETELWVPRAGQKPQANGQAVRNTPSSGGIQEDRGSERPKSPAARFRLHLWTSQKTNTQREPDWAADGGCLVIRFPFEPDFNPFGLLTEIIKIRVPLAPSAPRATSRQYTSELLSIWKDKPPAINVTTEISPNNLAKLKYFLGVSNPLALFRVDNSNRRAVTRSLPKDRPAESYSIGFADAFPLHILNIASVRAVDDDLPAQGRFKGKLDARRFRANIYVTGPSAYAEDTWKRVTIGKCIKPQNEAHHANGNADGSYPPATMVETDGEYHVACRTARCKLPNVDPDTGLKDVNEPFTTLSKTRQKDEGARPHPVLGLQAIPLFQQGILRVGDEIQVLERGEHFYEKMFKN